MNSRFALSNHTETTNQVGTNSEAGTTTSRGAHGGDEHIKNAKCGGGGEGQDNNLLNVQSLLGDGIGDDGNCQRLNKVLNRTLNKLC